MFEWEDGTKAEYEEYGGRVYIHFVAGTGWSPSYYKDLQRLWKVFLRAIKSKGYDEVYVAIPDNDPKLLKWERMFGFEIDKHENGIYLMKRSTEVFYGD